MPSVLSESTLSARCYRTMCDLLPGGVNSPVRAFKGLGIDPVIVAKGMGDQIWDLDDRCYIDFCLSWGALLLGHVHPKVVHAVQKQLAKGSSFGISTEIEGLLAKKVVEKIPSIERVRFVSSGTEATMTALRLARGCTGRSHLVKFSGNYHGHSDAFLVEAGSGLFGVPMSAGIPPGLLQYTINLPYNDSQALERLFSDPEFRHKIAAVIIEPVAANMGVVPPEPGFLELLRELTTAHGALLIFDEVVTGFRVAAAGAQQLYGVMPDLTCLGKVVGGGLPAAAVGGRRDLMELLAPLGPVYQAGTLSGNPLAMAAGLATLEELDDLSIYRELERKAELLCNPVRDKLLERNVDACLQRVGSMFTLFFGTQQVRNGREAQLVDKQLFASCYRHLLSVGIYPPPAQHEAWFISPAHTDDHLCYVRDALLAWVEQLPSRRDSS